MKYFREPSQAPRWPDIITLEGRKRVISAARLASYYIPRYSNLVLGYKQSVLQPQVNLLGPLSGVQEGLRDLVAAVEEQNNDNNRGS